MICTQFLQLPPVVSHKQFTISAFMLILSSLISKAARKNMHYKYIIIMS